MAESVRYAGLAISSFEARENIVVAKIDMFHSNSSSLTKSVLKIVVESYTLQKERITFVA